MVDGVLKFQFKHYTGNCPGVHIRSVYWCSGIINVTAPETIT